MALISAQNLGISFGGHALLDDATLQIERGERIGLLGRNGEGKSTLLKVIAGDIEPDAGRVMFSQGVTAARLTQSVPSGMTGDAGTLVAAGLPAGKADDHAVQRICSLLNIDAGMPFADMSGGQKRRVLLGRALVGGPDVLLLDEPTNHLDIESIQWLESFLLRFQGSLLFVTHDRAFLQRLATRIIELDRGRLTSWSCDYPTYLKRKEALLAGEEKEWDEFDKKLAREEAWIRQGIKARRTRNEGRVRALKALRTERAARRERVGEVNLNIQTAQRSGRKVIAAEGVSYRYRGPAAPGSGRTVDLPIVENFSTTILRGDKVGIMGPNGCGKTTLLNLLLRKLTPDTGTVEHGTALEVAYFDQHRHLLNQDATVFDNIADGHDTVTIHGQARHVISYLQDFLFSPDRVRMAVRFLSGGERNRLLLARLFTRSSNVLVLDEPTNDLDTETLELLEARLVEYEGTVLVVSHDRQFLDNLCTDTLVFEGRGVVRKYAGGYSDWLRCEKARPATAAPEKTPSVSREPGARKLSNREREEWKALPARIEQMEQEQAALIGKLADPAFLRGDPGAIRAATERSTALQGEIEQAFERWAELGERGP